MNQRQIYSTVSSEAVALSAKATPELLRLLESADMRKELQRCCASIAE
jgi:hypothetical protein